MYRDRVHAAGLCSDYWHVFERSDELSGSGETEFIDSQISAHFSENTL